MTTFRGRWSASVEQDFEIEADSKEEALVLVSAEIKPGNVVELLDIEVAFSWDTDE